MENYLEKLEKFNDDKEVSDLVKDVLKLRYLHNIGDLFAMQKHIEDMSKKYFFDTVIWNFEHRDMPTTYEQSYQNAEQFLNQRAKEILSKLSNKDNKKNN